MIKLKLEIPDGEIQFKFDNEGVTLRLYNSKGDWLATAGIATSHEEKSWTTWCADLRTDEWSTKHIMKGIEEEQDVRAENSN